MELVRARKSKLSLDMAPLIDVVFQLLVFFMLTSTFANPAIRLSLPKAATTDQPQQQRIVVSVTAKGDIYLNKERTSLQTLTADLRPHLQSSKNRAVHVQGDKDMPYKYFVQVMDLARQAGAKQVNIVHED